MSFIALLTVAASAASLPPAPAKSRIVVERSFKVSVRDKERLSKKFYMQFGSLVEPENLSRDLPFCSLTYSEDFIAAAVRFQPILKTYDLILWEGEYEVADNAVFEAIIDVPSPLAGKKISGAVAQIKTGNPPNEILIECVKGVGSKVPPTLDDWNGIFHQTLVLDSIAAQVVHGDSGSNACSAKDRLQEGAPLAAGSLWH
ncbi:hypothetical protein WDW86_05890 [Bdellovibrionota bacterium FG-2]